MNDSIADYYERCRKRQEEARLKWREAEREYQRRVAEKLPTAHAQAAVVARLYMRYIDAGDTGD